jgi:hypothetical protein
MVSCSTYEAPLPMDDANTWGGVRKTSSSLPCPPNRNLDFVDINIDRDGNIEWNGNLTGRDTLTRYIQMTVKQKRPRTWFVVVSREETDPLIVSDVTKELADAGLRVSVNCMYAIP